MTMINKIKSFFAHFFTLDDSAHNIAGGAALGIFLGILPGEGVATTLVLASIFKLNRASATAFILATNMWSTFVVLPIAAFVGGFLFNQTSTHLIDQFYQTYHLGFKFFLSKAIFFDLALPLISGYLVVSISISLAFYFLFLVLLKYYGKKLN